MEEESSFSQWAAASGFPCKRTTMEEAVLVLAYVARASRRGCAQLGVGSRISNPAQLMHACARTLRSAGLGLAWTLCTKTAWELDKDHTFVWWRFFPAPFGEFKAKIRLDLD